MNGSALGITRTCSGIVFKIKNTVSSLVRLVSPSKPRRIFLHRSGLKIRRRDRSLCTTKQSKFFYRIDFASLRTTKCIIYVYFHYKYTKFYEVFVPNYEVFASIHTTNFFYGIAPCFVSVSDAT